VAVVVHRCLAFALTLGCLAGTSLAFARAEQVQREGDSAPPRVTVTGRMVTGPDTPLPHPFVTFVGAGTTVQSSVTTDGRFEAMLAMGAYRVTVAQLPPGYTVRSLTAGTVDLREQPLEVRDAPPADIRVEVVYSGPAPRSVSGRVSGVENRPFSQVVVHLIAPVLQFETPLLPDGSFRFERVVPGAYTLSVSAPYPTRLPLLPQVPLRVLDADLTAIDVRPLQVGVVDGLVTTTDGAPLPWLSLRFTRPGSIGSANNLTGDTARFSTELQPGRYQVRVSGLSKGYEVTSVKDGTVDLLSNELNVEQGTAVSLRVETRTSLRFVTVTGRVTMRDPAVRLPGSIRLERPQDSLTSVVSVGNGLGEPLEFSVPEARAELRPDGTFTLTHVQPGSYVAQFLPDDYRVRGTPVTVSSDGLPNLDIVIPRRVDITGRLRVSGESPAIRLRIVVQASDTPDVRASRFDSVVDADGSFLLSAFEGDAYRISVEHLPNGFTLDAIQSGDRNIGDVPFSIVAGMPPLRILARAPARPTWHRVSGRLIGAIDQGRTSSVTIRMWDWAQGQSLASSISPDGRFEFPRVLPGVYAVSLDGDPDASLRMAGVPLSGEQKVEVRVDRDIDDLPLERVPPSLTFVMVDVQVIAEDGGPVPLLSFSSSLPGAAGQSSHDGRGQVRFGEGDQQIFVWELPPEFVLRELRYGDVDLREQRAQISASRPQQLRVRVAPKEPRIFHAVSGQIDGVERLGSTMRVLALSNSMTSYTMPLQRRSGFEFPRVVPGTYRLSARSGDDWWSVWDSVDLGPVEVRDKDAPGLRAVAPFRVRLEYRGVAGADADLLVPYLTRQNELGQAIGSSQTQTLDIYVRDGDRIVPGGLPPGYRFESLTFDGQDLLRAPIRIGTGRIPPMRGTIARVALNPETPAFTVSGRVVGTPRTGSVRFAVLRIDDGPTRRARVRRDGSFTFDRVTPGRHVLEVQVQWVVSRVVVSDRDVTGVVLGVAP
jgi:hypothetical protein